VQDATLVGVSQTRKSLHADGHHLLGSERAVLDEDAAQVAPLGELHSQVHIASII